MTALLISLDAASVKKEKKNLYDCTLSYLKVNEKLSSEKFINYEPEVAENFDCDLYVEGLREEFYVQVKPLFEKDNDFSNKSDCIIEKLRIFNLGDAYLEKYVYINDKSMSSLKQQKALSDVAAMVEQKIELAEELCLPEKMFGDWFDESYGEDPSENVTESEEDDVADLQEEYCQRKHLVDTQFIDTKKYDVTLNPKNVKVANLNCDQIWTETTQEYMIGLKDEFVSGLDSSSSKEIRCFMDTIKRGKYAETLMKLWVLGEIRITENQKIAERAGFISFLTNLYGDILKCQKSEI